MNFICTFGWWPDAEAQSEAIRRFRETGGQPPPGAQLLGRWTRADFTGGVLLLESNDPQALTQFALTWSDLMELEIFPVVDDQELVQVLNRAGR